MPTQQKKVVVKKPKPKCSYCKGVKKSVKGGQCGGCGCAGIGAPTVNH